MKDFLDNKVLVTGGAGFIGSHLVKRLVKAGAEVTVIVKYKSIFDCIRLSQVWDNINVIEADLRNIDSVIQLRSSYFDYIFHLAAYNHVGDSFIHFQEALQSNLISTANIFEYGPDYGRFIYTATSEVYGYQDSVPFKEENMPFPLSPYAIGKYSGELYAKMKAFQEDKKEIICIRPFNTFGPYQSERAIIPEIIIKCLRGSPIHTTEGKQTREFNFVENIVDGFLLAAKTDNIPSGSINIGSGEEIAIRNLVNKIYELCDSKSELKIGVLKNRPTEIWRMKADNVRAEKYLEWVPKIPFEKGLVLTINWFKKFVHLYFDGELKKL